MSVIVARGNPSPKIVDGQVHEVVPYAGADREGDFASFGVGFYFADKGGGRMWGLTMPHMLIHAWRAMKLLERIPHIDLGTLSACWYATSKREDIEKKYLDALGEQFISPDEFEAIRSEVAAMVPTYEEFDEMLTIVRDKNIDVSVQELTELIEQGKLPHHPIIDELIQRNEDWLREYESREAFLKAPLPPGESLSELLRELGINNMLDGIPFGAYGIDWGHIELKELDPYVKRCTTGKYGEGNRFPLRHTTHGPYTQSAIVVEGVTRFTTTFGEVEEPWYLSGDGTKYIFVEAAYHEGSIVVTTRFERVGSEPEVGIYTVPTLRASIVGPIPKPEARKRWRFFGRRA